MTQRPGCCPYASEGGVAAPGAQWAELWFACSPGNARLLGERRRMRAPPTTGQSPAKSWLR